MATDLYLIRHCSSVSQHPDAPLTADGEAQAIALGAHLGSVPFARIVSSPYARAMSSVRGLAGLAGLPLVTDDRLIEFRLSGDLNLADWQTHLRASFADADLALPGGESARAATARAGAAVDDARASAAGPVAVATHGRLMSLILTSFGMEFTFEDWRKLSNPDVYRIGPDGQIERFWTDG